MSTRTALLRRIIVIATISLPSAAAAQISITPDGDPITVGGSSLSAVFTISNQSSTAEYVDIYCNYSGVLTGCQIDGSQLVFVAAQGSAQVSVNFWASGSGTGTLQLEGLGMSGYDGGWFAVTVTSSSGGPAPIVTITPDSTVTTVRALSVAITWCDESSLNASSRQIKLNGIDVTAQFNYTNMFKCAAQAKSVGTIQLLPGSNVLTASIYDGSGYQGQASASFRYDPPVEVYPRNGVANVAAGSSSQQLFTLVNSGSAPAQVTLACAGAANCVLNRTSLSLQPNLPDTVRATFTAPTAGTSATVRLQAVAAADPATTVEGKVVAHASAATAPLIRLDSVYAGGAQHRGACLTISGGAAAGIECGDLRLVHPLPSVRTIGQVRTPTLIYNSAFAEPRPIVSFLVRSQTGSSTPDSVTAELIRNSVVEARGRWQGTAWAGAGTRRVAVQLNATTLSSGILTYTLQVSKWHGTTKYSSSLPVDVPIVNRRASPFGAGWWLAGLEQLDVNTKTWIGGDGSIHRYLPVAGLTNAWVAENDQSDSLFSYSGGVFERRLPGGLTISFTSSGRHNYTRNRLGYVTQFIYDGSGRLQQISIPPTGSGLAYTFAYVGGVLSQVTAPAVGGTQRIISATYPSGDERRFTGPGVGTGYVAFFTSGSKYITARRDRRGHFTTYTYWAAGKVAATRLPLGPTNPDSIMHRFRPAEIVGLSVLGSEFPAPSDTAQAFTEYVGPRTDTSQITKYWHTPRGNVTRVVNALGHATEARYRDPRHPNVVTWTQSPLDRVEVALYDRMGRLVEQTDSSSQDSTGRYATTRYEWNQRWSALAKVTSPLDRVKTFGYDTIKGHRLWEQRGLDVARRVYFRYSPSNHLLTSIKAPGATLPTPDPISDSLVYDARGNLVEIVSPISAALSYKVSQVIYRDNIGRDTLTTSHVGWDIGGIGQRIRKDFTRYDLFDRVIETKAGGPSLYYDDEDKSNLAQEWYTDTLYTEMVYDLNGNVDSITTRVYNNLNDLAPQVRTFAYDRANRVVKQTAPDGAFDSTVYDPAGNPRIRRDRLAQSVVFGYDVLNRLTWRKTPEIVNAPNTPADSFPLARNVGSNYVIAADSAVFSYDNEGRLLEANNAFARITREYYLNGALKQERQRIAKYQSVSCQGCGDFSAHDYLLKYRYDLEGMRVGMEHPSQLTLSGWNPETRYAYHSQTGTLDALWNPADDMFSFHFDNAFRLEGITNPNGTAETREYDGIGRLTHVTQTAPVNSDSGYADGYIHKTDLYYDDGNRVRLALDRKEMTRTWYTGLGALGWQDENYCALSVPCGHYANWVRTRTDIYVVDAYGNVRMEYGRNMETVPPHQIVHEYDSTTARTIETGVSTSGEPLLGGPYEHDAAGRMVYMGRWGFASRCTALSGGDCVNLQMVAYPDEKAMYYDAEGRLRATHRFTLHPGPTVPYRMLGGIEEYFYDALGRRVLTRWRGDCPFDPFNTSSCPGGNGQPGHVERYVHDGDQILYEIRMPGGINATVDSMESDNPDAVFTGQQGSQRYGWVLFTHGLGIDQALQVIRTRGSHSHPTLKIYLHANWRGQYNKGSNETGIRKWCKGSPPLCAPINFASQNIRSRRNASELPMPAEDPFWWVGSFLTTRTDMSGFLHMRNRYYDPVTGRFTQEDPIGLAGGLNLYGFAGGDPVNFSDPFGLSPNCCEDVLKVLNTAVQGGVALRIARGESPQIDLGTLGGDFTPNLLGRMLLDALGDRVRIQDNTSVTATLDPADGNGLIQIRGDVRVRIDGAPDVILTQINLNLGTGMMVGSGHLNGWRAISSVGAVGNIINETGTARAVILGQVVKELTHPPRQDDK